MEEPDKLMKSIIFIYTVIDILIQPLVYSFEYVTQEYNNNVENFMINRTMNGD